MITHSDDGPDFDADDPLAVIMRPPAEHLGPPPGRYEAIRRGAARRRLLRAAAGAGLACAVGALVALPLRAAAPEPPVSPVVPLAPPPASSPSAEPTPSVSPGRVSPFPSGSGRSDRTSAPSTAPTAPVRSPVRTRTPSAIPTSASVEPSGVRTGANPTPSRAVQR
ncbi:hypothetical protein ABZX90_20970 [Streptomyces sp. NPDC002935]|uniref:hypothetical protein n=1 Tax=Streptomyces sp. NPDC002935 TaxID=3154545 RepID=UPI0033AB1DB4